MIKYEGTFNVICRIVRKDEEGNVILTSKGKPWISKAIVGQVQATSRKEAKRMAIEHFSDLAVLGKPTVAFLQPKGLARIGRSLFARMSKGTKPKDIKGTKKGKKKPTASEARANAADKRADRKRKAKHVKKNRTRRGA